MTEHPGPGPESTPEAPSMVGRLIEELRARNIEVSWRDVVDAVWLAAVRLERRLASEGPRATDVEAADTRAEAEPPGVADPSRPEKTPKPEPEPEKPRDSPARTGDAAAPLRAPEPTPAEPGPAEGDGPRGVGLGRGTPVRVPGVPALPEALALGRALRPLARREPSPTLKVLDEPASIRSAADLDLWVPVLRPARVRAFKLALVVDAAASMAAWFEALDEFRRVLERAGAFRDVRVWRLRPDDARGSDGGLRLVPESGSRRARRRPEELSDPTGRRLILVASDCASAPWHSGQVRALLTHWGQRQPVAILQVLPPSLWRQTGLGRPARVVVRAPRAGAPNVRLLFDVDVDRDDSAPLAGLPVPVLPLEPEPLAAWARMLSGPGAGRCTALLLRPGRTRQPARRPAGAAPDLTTTPPDPDLLIARFAQSASRPAQELAACLSAAPLILPVMRLVQRAMLPNSRPAHLAEFLLGGLVDVQPSKTGDPADLAFEFRKGVRDRLISRLEFHRAVEAFSLVSRQITDHFGDPLDFQALIDNPGGLIPFHQDERTRAFAQVAAALLSRLGGVHAEVARRLVEGSKRGPDPVREPRELALRLHRSITGDWGNVEQFRWSPDGRYVAYLSDRGRLVIRSWTDPDERYLVDDLTAIPTVRLEPLLAWSPDSRWLVYTLQGFSLSVHDMLTHRMVRNGLPVGRGKCASLAWSPDGARVAVGTREPATVFFPSLPDMARDATWFEALAAPPDPADILEYPEETPAELAWSSDGETLAAGFSGGAFRLIDRDRAVTRVFSTRSSWEGGAPVGRWWPGGRYLASTLEPNKIAVLDAAHRCGVRVLDTGADTLYTLSLSADGRFLAAGMMGRGFVVWRCDTWEIVVRSKPSNSWLASHVAFHPRDAHLLASIDGGESTLCIWEIEGAVAVGPPSFDVHESATGLFPSSSIGRGNDLLRLGLFAPAPAEIGISAVGYVLDKQPEELANVLNAMTAARRLEGVPGRFRYRWFPPPAWDEWILPRSDPACARFVEYYQKRVSWDDSQEDFLRDLPQIERAVNYAGDQPDEELKIILRVLVRLAALRNLDLLRVWADRGVEAADGAGQRLALGEIAALVRKAGAAEGWTGRARERLDALGLLGPAAETLSSAMKVEEDFKRAMVQGLAHQAIPLARQVFRMRSVTLGEDHRETLRAQIKLGEALLRSDQLDEARDVLSRSLEIGRRVFGEDALGTATVEATLAAVLRRQGQFDEAEKPALHALSTREKIFGRYHLETARSLAGLAALESRRGRPVDAEIRTREALEIRRRVLGDDRLETARSWANLAALVGRRGDHEQAAQLWLRAFQIRSRSLGPDHRDTLRARDGLVAAYRVLGWDDLAELIGAAPGQDAASAAVAGAPLAAPDSDRPDPITLSPSWEMRIADALAWLPRIHERAVRETLGLPMGETLSEGSELTALVRIVAAGGRAALDRLLATADALAPKPTQRQFLLSWIWPPSGQASVFAQWREQLDEILQESKDEGEHPPGSAPM
jgi:tetratricopeptide (TPR) repeat protein